MRNFVLPVLALAASLLITPHVHAQNYVQNAGFENGLSGWDWGLNGGTAACSVDTTQHHWGQNALRLTYSGGYRGGQFGRLARTVSGLTPGNTYYAYVWCKGSGAGSHTQLATGSRRQFHAKLPSGTFGWTCVELGFKADARTMPLAVLVQDTTSELWIDDVYLTADRRTNANGVGVPDNSQGDVTAALQNALNTYKFVYLPAGTYHVSSSITLPPDALIWGDGAATVIQETNASNDTQFLDSSGTGGSYAGNDEVSAVKFVGVVDKSQFGVHLYKAQNILIQNCSTLYCGLVNADTQTPYANIASENDLTRHVTVSSNDIEATSQHPGKADGGVRLAYVADALVSNNTVNYFANGIEWWGGDSKFVDSDNSGPANGAFENPRWARRISITGNTVDHSAGGGIWGSMGQNVTISHNHVSHSGDVGIDFEGCFDSTADFNTVAASMNGELTTFFATKNLKFLNNTVSSNDPARPVFRVYAGSEGADYKTGSYAGKGSTLSGNTFTCTSGIGTFDDHVGPSVLTVTGNHFNNVKIDISGGLDKDGQGDGNLVYAPTITDNTLTFSTDTPGPLAGINVFSQFSDPTVSSNVVTYTGATQANKTGIQVRTLANTSSTLNVNSNTVRGFSAADIHVYCNPPGTSTATVTGNHAQGAKIEIGPTGATAIHADGNVDLNGAGIKYTALP